MAGLPEADDGAHLVNWSATHEVHPRRLFQPESLEQLEALVASHHRTGGYSLEGARRGASGGVMLYWAIPSAHDAFALRWRRAGQG